MVHDNEADKVVEEVAKVRKFAKKSWNALDNWSWVLGSHIVGGYGDKVADKMEEADKMFEEVVQVEKIACFLGSWWGGSANLSNFIKGKCHMGKWHIIALFEQINTDHKKQQSKVLVAALSMLDVSYFVVDCERSIWAVDRHQAIWKKSLLSGIHINRV